MTGFFSLKIDYTYKKTDKDIYVSRETYEIISYNDFFKTYIMTVVYKF